jgi:hypothetical protein
MARGKVDGGATGDGPAGTLDLPAAPPDGPGVPANKVMFRGKVVASGVMAAPVMKAKVTTTVDRNRDRAIGAGEATETLSAADPPPTAASRSRIASEPISSPI